MRAPKKVPAERIETMRDVFHEGITKSFAGVVAGSYHADVSRDLQGFSRNAGHTRFSKVEMKYFIPMTPLMYPES